MQLKNTIILTGAGFTANFGGFLAKEMWTRIFNNSKLNSVPRVKKALLENFDFEDVYSKIIDERSQYAQDEVATFEQVLDEAYYNMESILKQPFSSSLGLHPGSVRQLFDLFKEPHNGSAGACFTLNQDLFFERNYEWQPLGPSSMRYSNGGFINDLNSDNPKILPNNDELQEYIGTMPNDFYFVKLHGSIKWVAADGSSTKVIGVNKPNIIRKIPLLNWYFDLFKQALSRHNTRLLVIGYGFRDLHINQYIHDAARDFGIKIFIVSTENPKDFHDRLTNTNPKWAAIPNPDQVGIQIWNNVVGYFPYSFRQIFPLDQSDNAAKQQLFSLVRS